jgi:uncharacterized RDD family membrane protein YckC
VAVKVFGSFRGTPDPCPVCDAQLPAELAQQNLATSQLSEVSCPHCGNRLLPLRVAAMWRRIVAGAADVAIVCVPIVPLNAWVFSWSTPKVQQASAPWLAEVIDLLTGDLTLAVLRWSPTLFAVFLYFAVFHGFFGQTLVQQRLGVRVTDGEGNAPTLVRASLRSLAMIASFLTFGLGHVWALFDPHGRTWHDHLTSTYVVRAS